MRVSRLRKRRVPNALQGPTGAVPLLLLAAVACSINVDPPEFILWETTLIAEPVVYPDLAGTAAAITRSGGTDAGIEVSGLALDDTLAWRIRAGDCSSPGAFVGPESAYPHLVESDGAAREEAFLFQTRLTAGNTYHVVVLTLDEPPQSAACGILEQI